jgi:dihydroflavonol-4-reductase
MEILVTGATGFVGSSLVGALSAAGHGVHCLSRSPGAGSARDSRDIIRADINDRDSLESIPRGIDAVFHLAAALNRPGTRARDFIEANVRGTRNLADLFTRRGVGQFVHCSTAAVSGPTGDVLFDEAMECRPASLYEKTKLMAERILSAHSAAGFPVTILRPSIVYGPGDRRLLGMFRMVKGRRFVFPGSGLGLLHPLYIDDLTAAFLKVLGNRRTAGETYIISGDAPVSYRRFVGEIAGVQGVPSPGLHVPALAMRTLASFADAVGNVAGMKAPFTRETVNSMLCNYAYSAKKARRLLGFSPATPLRSGLSATVGWYSRNGLL